MSKQPINPWPVQIRSVRLCLLLPAFFLLTAGCTEGGKATEPNFNAVQEGMTREQVEALLGPNHEVVKDVQFSLVIQQNPQANRETLGADPNKTPAR